jgi:spermidine synthase
LLGAAGVQIGVAVLSGLLLFVFPELPFWYVGIYDTLAAGTSPTLVFVTSMTVAVLVMTPPALLMGIAFPLGVRAITARDPGGPVGRFYAANTLGGVAGAALAGFLLLPNLGVDGTVILAVMINLLGAGLLLGAAWGTGVGWRVIPWGGAAGLTAAIAALWVLVPRSVEDQERRQLLMTAGMYKYVVDVTDHTRAGILRYAVDQYDLLYYREGVSSVVTVAKNKESGNIWLANNGKVEASTTVDMPTQVLVSLLPFLFVEDPQDVLVIGLASGITAGSAGTVQSVKHLEIVELEPAIEPAARFFDAQNHRVLDDPRTRLVFNDGRNHVLLASPGSWDVVVSEPSNPWISGVSNLFTREFLALGKTRLKPGGVWAQWVQMYGMGPEDLRALLATFTDVYPHVALFMTVEDADLVILGSERPLEPSAAGIAKALERWPTARAELQRVSLDNPEKLLSTWQMGRDGVLRLTKGVVLNTDDNMRIEYAAPLHLHASTSAENVEMLLEYAELPPSVVDPLATLRMATFYLERDDFDRGLHAAELAFTRTSHEDLVSRVTGVRAREGWEKGLVALISVAEDIARREGPGTTWDIEVARWRIALLGYFGEPVPDGLRARLPKD